MYKSLSNCISHCYWFFVSYWNSSSIFREMVNTCKQVCNFFFNLSSIEISTKSTWYLSYSLLVLIYLATLFSYEFYASYSLCIYLQNPHNSNKYFANTSEEYLEYNLLYFENLNGFYNCMCFINNFWKLVIISY